MKYKLQVTENKKSYTLKPCLDINDVAYWQKRINALLPTIRVTAKVDK